MFHFSLRQPSGSLRKHQGRRRHARLEARPLLESLEDRAVPATLIVNTIADDAYDQLSLRAAINAVNAQSWASLGGGALGQVSGTFGSDDTILFNIPGTGVQTIALASALPAISKAVSIDGTTQPGFAGTPIIELDGTNAGPADGLSLIGPDNVIRGLIINRFNGNGISVSGAAATGNRISGNFIGTDATGTVDLGNVQAGIFVLNSAANTIIGGATAADRNLISGNGPSGSATIGDSGVQFQSAGTGNVVLGNYVGTDVSGALGLGNAGSGVQIDDTPGVTIGSNLLSANGAYGVSISGAGSIGCEIAGNLLGTDANGTAGLGNTFFGVYVLNSAANTIIGGATVADRNLISGNGGAGVYFKDADTGNVVLGNYIGTDVSGTKDLGNSGSGVLVVNTPGVGVASNLISFNMEVGIAIQEAGSGNCTVADNEVVRNQLDGIFVLNSAANTTIGPARLVQTTTGHLEIEGNIEVSSNTVSSDISGNVISGNGGAGVHFYQAGTGNVVQGNFIGTDVTGTADLGNGGDGVWVLITPDVTIGGASPGQGNVISGNDGAGVEVSGVDQPGTVIQGNFIGTDVTGTLDVGNASAGVFILDQSGVLVGGTAPGARNVISGNGGRGIDVYGTSIDGVTVQGNFIGTDVTGTADLGNDLSGVEIVGAKNVTIGGATPAARNVISGNGLAGVLLDQAGTGAVIQGNFIGANAAATANLGNGGNGVTILSTSSAIGVGNLIVANAGDGVLVNGDASGNSIGAPGAGNVISANAGDGVQIDGNGNAVQGNTISGNGAFGVLILGTGNRVLGSHDAPQVISHNALAGVRLQGGGNTLAGNDVTANGNDGVYVAPDANANTIGLPNGGNVISANAGDGVHLDGKNTLVQGNVIFGNLAHGAPEVADGHGVFVSIASSSNTIGGPAPDYRNTIYANANDGVHLDGGGNVVQGNFIGLDVSGQPAGNAGHGVFVSMNSSGNTIGGPAPVFRNVISGNGDDGVQLDGNGNVVQGNFVGTSADGNVALGNAGNGVLILGNNNQVLATGAPQVISGNNGDGVLVGGAGNVIAGNVIGTSPDGAAIPNGLLPINVLTEGNVVNGVVNAPVTWAESFVSRAYRSLLGRPVDPSGLVTFTAVMNQGGAEMVVRGIMASAEYKTKAVNELYRQFLHREGDPNGLTGFVAALNAGATMNLVRSAILGSEEYLTNSGGYNVNHEGASYLKPDGPWGDFLTALYWDALGRKIDDTGLAEFSTRLSAGVSRAVVVDEIFRSAEFMQHRVRKMYQRFLDREPDPVGMAGFTAAMGQGASDEQMIAGMVLSPEHAGPLA